MVKITVEMDTKEFMLIMEEIRHQKERASEAISSLKGIISDMLAGLEDKKE